MRQGQAVRNPIAKKAQFVFNARLDAFNQIKQRDAAQKGEGCGEQLNGNCDEVFCVKPYELVFRYLDDDTKTEGAADTKVTKYSDGRNYVFSALNGLQPEHKIDLAGVAVGSSSGLQDRMAAQGFAVERSSINTIMNTGDTKITTGQYVDWYIPGDKRIVSGTPEDVDKLGYAKGAHLVGVPKQKRCAIVKGNAVRNFGGVQGRSGYVGQALSSAEPGRPFDVLLEPCPHYG